jgi:hypothetical protein
MRTYVIPMPLSAMLFALCSSAAVGINLNAAKQIGLAIPLNVFARAERVIR